MSLLAQIGLKLAIKLIEVSEGRGRGIDGRFALLDTGNNRMAAMGNSLPFYWDRSLEELPEGGWDWVFLEAIENHKDGKAPSIQSAIQINIHPDYQSQGLSAKMVKAMRAIGQSEVAPEIPLGK